MFTHLLKREPQFETEIEPLPPVMEAMGFSWDDLHANRVGQISATQQKRLFRHTWRYTFWILLGLLLMPLFSAPFIERVMRVILGIQSFFSLTMLVYIVIALVPAVPLLWAMRKQAEIREDVQQGTVEMLKGRVIVTTQGRRYTVNLDANRFDVSRQVASAFVDHGGYVLYIAPRTRVLLGAEEVSR